MEQFSNIPLI